MADYLCCESKTWQPSIDVIGRVGNFRKGGGGAFFAPIGQNDCSLLFLQAEGGYFRELYAGSIGLGYRSTLEYGFSAGINGFFDIARSNSGQAFYQGGIGLEAIGDCWIIRANGYFPSRRDHLLSSRRESDVVIVENQLVSTDTHYGIHEQAYYGFDVEIGRGIELGCGQLWGYGGYYRFDSDHAPVQDGPRLRIEYIWDANPFEISVSGEWERNDVHGSTLSAVAGIRIPLGAYGSRSTSCCDFMCRQMGNRVWRNNAIWVDPSERIDQIVTLILPQQIFFVDQNGGGPGTQSTPGDIAAAQAFSPPDGKIVFCLPNTGPIAFGGPYTLAAEEQFHGFGDNGMATIDLGDGRSVTVRPLAGQMTTRADLLGPNGLSMFDANFDNNLFSGLRLDGSAGTMIGISAAGLDIGGLVIDDTVITSMFSGINGLIRGLSVSGSTFSAIGADAIDTQPVSGGSMSILVEHSTFSGISARAIVLNSSDAFLRATVRNNIFSTVGLAALLLENTGGSVLGYNVVVDENSCADVGTLVDDTTTGAPGSVRSLLAENNTSVLGMPFTGIVFNLIPTSEIDPASTRYETIIRENTVVSSNRTLSFSPTTENDGDVVNLLFERNAQDNGSLQTISGGLLGLSPGAFNMTIRNNMQSNSSPVPTNPGYEFGAFGGTTNQLCATAFGNNTNNGITTGGFRIFSGSSVSPQITAFGRLSQINNDIGVEVIGITPISNTIFPCPTPRRGGLN